MNLVSSGSINEVKYRLGLFVDAAVEVLEADDLKLTALTRYNFKGVDKVLIDQILWELEDLDIVEVARKLKVEPEFVEKVARLSGAEHGRRTLAARAA